MTLVRKLLLLTGSLTLLGFLGLTALYWWLPVNIPLVGGLFGSQLEHDDEDAVQARLSLPDGYDINIFASGIVTARVMQGTPSGHILVTARDPGEIVLVRRDDDSDGQSDGQMVLAEGLTTPHGLWLDGSQLYVGEEHQLVRFDYDDDALSLTNKTVIVEGLPDDGDHYTRTVKVGPDGWLYVTIGSSCNVCVETHPWRAAMIRTRPGGTPEIYATGLRNTVGFDWQPGSGALFGVDNGRDWLGDDFPPDELNHIVQGGFYGWPQFNGDNLPDPDEGGAADATALDPQPPAFEFAAHVAPLGITFLHHQSATPLNGGALVTQHGSWNRDTMIGYDILHLVWRADGTIHSTPFVTGFERDGDVIGRPVDVLEVSDGTLYVTDDYGDVIYRILYRHP
jgi:glucose/arabinose dehydrogenase